MYYLKACPRCLGGDLVRVLDSRDGPEVYCFQCGYRLSRGEELRLRFDVGFDLSDGLRNLLHGMSPLA